MLAQARVHRFSPWLLLALTTCTPRVPATLELGEPPAHPRTPAPTPTNEPRAPGFDPNTALDGAELALLTIDQLRSRPGPNAYDEGEMDSYLTDQGLRSLYYYATVADLSLGAVGVLFATEVFIDGPHGQSPDFSASSFGRYNPEFVERVTVTARALGQDPARVERTREAFERQLRRQALTYLLVYEAIHRDPDWYTGLLLDYRAMLEDRDGGRIDWRTLTRMNEAFESAGMSWYETDTAAYFWLRRDFDGTAAAWREALEALLTAYGVDTRREPPFIPH
jgi:hypothetical protein